MNNYELRYYYSQLYVAKSNTNNLVVNRETLFELLELDIKMKSNIDEIIFNPHRVSFEGNIANNEIIPIIVDVNHVR